MSEETTTAAPSTKSFSRIKIAAIVAVVVLAQCGLAYMYLPAGDPPAEDDKKAAEHEDDHHASHAIEHREVDLGQFSLTAFDATSNTTLLIDFHLYGIVAEESKKEGEEEADGGHGHSDKGPPENHSAFGKLFASHKHRFRDAVIITIRNAELADLADPGLGLIKRQILAKTNTLLGEPLVKDVIFSDFAVVEQ